GPRGAPRRPGGRRPAPVYRTRSPPPCLAGQICAVKGVVMGVNSGANKARSPHPVPADSRVRATATLKETQDIAIGTQAVLTVVVEIDGVEKPACIAEVVYVLSEG